MNGPRPTRDRAPRRRRRLGIPITATVGIVGASLLLTMTPANAATATDAYYVGDSQTTFSRNATTFTWQGNYAVDPNGNQIYACSYDNVTKMAIDGYGNATLDIQRELDALNVKWARQYLSASLSDADRDLGGQVSFRSKYTVDYSSAVTCPSPQYPVKQDGGTTAQRKVVATAGGFVAFMAVASLAYISAGYYNDKWIGTSKFEAAVGCLGGLVGLEIERDIKNDGKLPWYDYLIKCSAGSVAFAGLGRIAKVFGTTSERQKFNEAVVKAIDNVYGNAQVAAIAVGEITDGMWAAVKQVYRDWRDGRLGRLAATRHATRLHRGARQ